MSCLKSSRNKESGFFVLNIKAAKITEGRPRLNLSPKGTTICSRGWPKLTLEAVALAIDAQPPVLERQLNSQRLMTGV
jgi:hypothetical protein